MARGRGRPRKNGLNDEIAQTMQEAGIDVETESATPAINSAARAEIIREACQTCEEFERQIDGLKAEIKAVIETRIVAGLGMKKRDFGLARKLYALDESDRDGTFDAIRECFAALGVGQQLNWLDAVGGEDAARAD